VVYRLEEACKKMGYPKAPHMNGWNLGYTSSYDEEVISEIFT
jgi:hypothetical protein